MAVAKATKIPSMIYGTAWKKDRTRHLVKQALMAGFVGVDTAAQPKHYREDLVGQGVMDAIREGGIKREHLYIQTKFTAIHGQDPLNLPYDPSQSITDQVATSVGSSLANFQHDGDDGSPAKRTSYIDCLVLHSPYPSMAETQEAWRAMEHHVPSSVRTLGISNIYDPQALVDLYEFAKIKPSVVQNRFYPATRFDTTIRAFCVEKGMVYQSFWTLSANPAILRSNLVRQLAGEVGVSREVVLYGLVLALGNTAVLNGTTNAERMRDDLAGIEQIRLWSERNAEEWQEALRGFSKLIT